MSIAYLLLALCAAGVMVLVWVNVRVFRTAGARPHGERKAGPQAREQLDAEAGRPSADWAAAGRRRRDAGAHAQANETGALGGQSHKAEPSGEAPAAPGRADAAGGVQRAPAAAPLAGSPEGRRQSGEEPHRVPAEPTDIEVVAEPQPPQARLFDRPNLPYRLYDAGQAAFADAAWAGRFRRLTEDPRVLGWVAFHGEVAGAADRDYDHRFLDVLRGYRSAVERLRREVGLTHVAESQVAGRDGKVWMVNLTDDIWLALFVDHAADPSLWTDMWPSLADAGTRREDGRSAADFGTDNR
ncbi:MAG: hypothetical protein IRZ33_08855 [Alicyclobacillaceae bacterium]|nr:hypothetical protein [Alicyclobacillaceae bacterium]